MSSALLKKAKEDRSYVRYQKIVKSAAAVPVDEYMDEVIRLHKNRKSTKLEGKKFSSERIYRCLAQDQAYRGRIVAVRVEVTRVYQDFAAAIEAATMYFLSEYKDLIPGRSIEERKGNVRNLLKDGYRLLNLMETMFSVTEEIIDDIDKAGYALKNSVEVMTLTNKREYT